MEYLDTVKLKDGRECVIRSCTESDGKAAWVLFNMTHSQSDFLLTYPEENTFTAEQEAFFLERKARSPREAELIAVLDGRAVGLAGIDGLGAKEKIRHRASFGISVDKAYWGLGIGRALTGACIQCAKKAGYSQLELETVADNERAVSLYKSLGFAEYGRNPRGFRSRLSGWQELVLMRLELD